MEYGYFTKDRYNKELKNKKLERKENTRAHMHIQRLQL